MQEAQAQMAINAANAERVAAAEASERQRVEAANAAKRSTTTSSADAALAQGRSWGQNRLGSLGYDDNYGLLDTYNNMLTTARGKVPEMSENVGSYFDYDNIWNNATTQAQGAQQTRLDNQFRDKTRVGWQQDYFADTADDSILDAILGDQYGEAFDTLDAARARGQLSQGAFDNSLRGLDTKRLGARSTLEDMGLGVLSGYRDELTGVSKQYGDQVTGYKLGQNLNLDDMDTALTQRKDALSGRMQGDIYRAIGDTSLFNTDSLMARGSSKAGVSNNPLRNAFATQGNNNALDPNRTTGTSGVF